MTQEEKSLLLQDISARLPYGVKINYGNYDGCDYKVEIISPVAINDSFPIEDIKPYLCPMSSMTKDEKEELVDFGLAYWDMGKHTDEDGNTIIYGGKEFQLLPDIETYDWLNRHHFDYRGLIERGLAIEVTEENNPYRK